MKSERFTTQSGRVVRVQVPAEEVARVMAQVVATDPLIYGDYDQVAFVSASGTQQFHAMGTGRNAATAGVVTVPCTEVTFFVGGDVVPVVEAIYASHPYEEPVIYIEAVTRTLHIRGLDEGNPNRFWNRPTPDWVPVEHK